MDFPEKQTNKTKLILEYNKVRSDTYLSLDVPPLLNNSLYSSNLKFQSTF